jgi:tryptophan synthase alpha subunit
MTYYNPVLAFGLKAFARTAVDARVDGVIVPDQP